MVSDKLNERQRKFVLAYAKSGNALQSAIEAGYSEKTAGSIGQRLLNNVEVAAALKKLGTRRTKRKLDSIEGRRAWLMSVIEGELSDVHVDKDGVDSDVRPSLPVRLKAIDQLSKMSGDYITKVEASGTMTHALVNGEEAELIRDALIRERKKRMKGKK